MDKKEQKGDIEEKTKLIKEQESKEKGEEKKGEGPDVGCSLVEGKSGQFFVFNNLFKAFFGVAIMVLAYDMIETGVLPNPIIMIIACIASYYMATLVIEVTEHMNEKVINLTSLAEKVLGRAGGVTTGIILVFCQIGVAISYACFFINFIKHGFCNTNVKVICNNGLYVYLISLAIFIPLSLIPKMSKLAYFSFIANIFIFFTVFAITGFASDKIAHDGVAKDIALWKWGGLPVLICAGFFATRTTNLLFEIRDSMEKPEKFISLVRIGYIFLVIILALSPIVWYLAYSSTSHHIILFNIPFSHVASLIAQFGYSLVMAIGFSLQLFPLFVLVESIGPCLASKDQKWGAWVLWLGLRALIGFLLVTIAFLIPSLPSFISFIGALGGTAMQYIIPVFIYHVYFKDPAKKHPVSISLLIFHIIIAVICSVIGVVGAYFSIAKLIDTGKAKKPPLH